MAQFNVLGFKDLGFVFGVWGASRRRSLAHRRAQAPGERVWDRHTIWASKLQED